jgi:hypothetical protein
MSTWNSVTSVLIACVVTAGPGGAAAAQDTPARGREGALATPNSLHTQHQQLLEEVARARADKGAVGDAARVIERTLAPHLTHEEELVLLPLGLIRGVVHNELPADLERVRTIVAQIDREMPQLVREHSTLIDAAKRFRDTAAREGKKEYFGLADRLWLHAVVQDQVLYPASILVGRYLDLREGPKPRPARSPAQ